MQANPSLQTKSPPMGTKGLDALAGPAGKTILLVGAGGCGMRGLARLFLQAGWQVWGQDQHPLPATDPLFQLGLQILKPQQPLQVSWVVRSAAVPASESHVCRAIMGGARSALYSEMLGELSRLRPVLAVAGSHGKTTVTAWLAYGLRLAGLEVGYLVGAEVPQLPASSDWGDAQLPLILESCEYARSFHALRPQQVALLNVDAEHPDTYPAGLPEVTQAFREFLALLPATGQVFAGVEAPNLADATSAAWSLAPALDAAIPLGLAGDHNRRNAALVAHVLSAFGLPQKQILQALAHFQGAARRLEVVGQLPQDVLVVSDYAHHPVEVQATLQAAKERWPERRLCVVFQPHQAQRFHAYRELFAPSLDAADVLLLLEIYRARDPEELEASVQELIPELQARPGKVKRPLATALDLAQGRQELLSWLQPQDVVLCLGAGDVDAFARNLR